MEPTGARGVRGPIEPKARIAPVVMIVPCDTKLKPIGGLMQIAFGAWLLLVSGALGGPALRDGDRIVLVGDTLIERDARYGWTESGLLLASPARNLVIRNLGWSGDTPAGLSRAYFDSPEVGFQRLVQQVQACQPTIVVVGYGMASALDGVPVEQFLSELRHFVESVKPAPREWVFLSPIQAKLETHADDANQLAGTLSAYADGLKSFASEKKGTFVDLRSIATKPSTREPSGIHLSDAGYRELADHLVGYLAAPKSPLAPSEGIDRLRAKLYRKNSLYFERYRPQNITYLLGFRAYEQGQNAKEIEALDPVISQLEQEIEKMRMKMGVLGTQGAKN